MRRDGQGRHQRVPVRFSSSIHGHKEMEGGRGGGRKGGYKAFKGIVEDVKGSSVRAGSKV